MHAVSVPELPQNSMTVFIFSRLPGDGSGSGDDRKESGRGSGTRPAGTGELAGKHHRGQWQRVLRSCAGGVGHRQRCAVVFYPARATSGERLHREFQRAAARRVFERRMVFFAGGRAGETREIPRALQSSASAQFAGGSSACGVRRAAQTGGEIFSTSGAGGGGPTPTPPPPPPTPPLPRGGELGRFLLRGGGKERNKRGPK